MCSAMNAFRLISLPVHGALELVLGIVVMVGALGLGLTPAGTVLAFTAGVIAIGLALGAVEGGVRSSAHASGDLALAMGAIAASAALAVAGDAPAAGLLVAFGVIQTGLASVTRYTKR